MNILLVHPRLSVKGGGERVAIHSILAATKSGHEVSLLTEDLDEAGFEDFYGCSGLFNRIHRSYYPAFKPLLGSRALLYQRLIYNWFQIRRAAAMETYDLVLSTQDIEYVPSTCVPAVQYCYFTESFSHLATDQASPTWRIYYRPATIYYLNRVRRVGTLLSVSDFTRGFVKKNWGRDSSTLYPPCPVEDYSEFGGVQFRENLVITIGRLVPEKRLGLFVDLARMVPKTKFVAVGSPSDRTSTYYERVRQEAPGNVSFVLSPLRKVKDVLGRAMAYVHCAENEHFGITIVEAMAAGCDLRTAADCISKLSHNDELRQRLSVAAAARAKRFSPEMFESKMLKLFEYYERR